MTSISNPSKTAHMIRVPSPSQNFKAKFIYNFYTADESTQEQPIIPEAYKKRTINKSDVNLINFSSRIPRAVELTWDIPKFANLLKPNQAQGIEANKEKINSEDDIVTSKYLPFSFSSYGTIQNASYDIRSDMMGMLLSERGVSQATVIDKFVSELLENYDENDEKNDIEKIKNDIKTAISSIEKFGDQADKFLGYKFFNETNEPMIDVTAFQRLNTNINLNCQLRKNILVDLFISSSMPQTKINQINTAYSTFSDENINDDDFPSLIPIDTLQKNNISIPDGSNTFIIGYIIDRFEFSNNSYSKDKTIYVENPNTNNILDVNVKYGATYYYAIRTVCRLEIDTIDDELKQTTSIFYLAGKPTTTYVTCEEDVPPPEPVDLNFIWNYKENKFYVTWALPFNSQRDIKQFQIFRRSSIHEPFELLQQQCFDFSNVKRTTGEKIDGNKQDMSNEDTPYVVYMNAPSCSYRDDDFKINTETLTASKYIYSIASIDAHGFISNYSAQFEVTFDFFKNQLIKKLISNAGAPRPYPNMFLNADLFKDVIQTSGMASQKLKIYFMPEYFKIEHTIPYRIEKMVSTTQDGGYYKMQFINTQNQKMDELTIQINDPKNSLSS